MGQALLSLAESSAEQPVVAEWPCEGENRRGVVGDVSVPDRRVVRQFVGDAARCVDPSRSVEVRPESVADTEVVGVVASRGLCERSCFGQPVPRVRAERLEQPIRRR